jgi:CBS domain-containing protein
MILTGNRPGIGGGNAMRTMSDIVRDQRPLMLPPGATVMQAARHMRERRVGAVLVTEGDRELVGIFTGRDAVSRVVAEGKDPGGNDAGPGDDLQPRYDDAEP